MNHFFILYKGVSMHKHDLHKFYHHLKENTNNHFGYPCNLNYDYRELLPFFEFSLNNIGDPFIPSNYKIESKQFEREVIKYFGQLFGLDEAWGYVTSGGTIGNMFGIILGRETLPDAKLYFAVSSHYSLVKAGGFFRIETIQIMANAGQEMNYKDLYEKLDPNVPAIINANIGTTFEGAVDDIDKIIDCLNRKGIRKYHIHCDAALGGMLVHFAKPEWVSFKKNIHSLSISGHKFIGIPFPCGIVITRKELISNLGRDIEYIGTKDTTIGGSRNGHAPLFLWYAIQERGDKFADEVKTCIENAKYLKDRLKHYGINCTLNKYSTTVVFSKPSTVFIKKYQLATEGNFAHVVIMQNHNLGLIDQFVEDLLYDLETMNLKIQHA